MKKNDIQFRNIKADEIDIRIGTINKKGASLLLYKDARVDMNILDDAVGNLGWKKEYTNNNANCIVSIWDYDKNVWVSKEDTGTESRADGNGNEKKGLASDSFKRACFNWGIGRELYTAPFIWIYANQFDLVENNRKFTTNDKFSVKEIEITDKKIVKLEIIRNGKETVFVYPKTKPVTTSITKKDIELLKERISKSGIPEQNIIKSYGVTLEKFTKDQFDDCLKKLDEWLKKLKLKEKDNEKC